MSTTSPTPPASTPPPDDAAQEAQEALREVALSAGGAALDEKWKRAFIVERQGRSFVLYAGLLDLAHQRGLRNITTTIVQIPSELNGMTAIVHATVDTTQGSFSGLGDANPQNVSRMMLPHLIRMAETRAKARALRDATNVGVTAFEELGELPSEAEGRRQDGDREFVAGKAAEPAWGTSTSAGASPAGPRRVQRAGDGLEGLATAEQKGALARLHRALGLPNLDEAQSATLLAADAGRQILALQEQLQQSRTTGPGGPGAGGRS